MPKLNVPRPTFWTAVLAIALLFGAYTTVYRFTHE